jgi:hypothetical protein
MWENFRPAEKLLSSRKGLCWMELVSSLLIFPFPCHIPRSSYQPKNIRRRTQKSQTSSGTIFSTILLLSLIEEDLLQT